MSDPINDKLILYEPLIRRVVRAIVLKKKRLVIQAEDYEDLFQAARISVWRNLPKYDCDKGIKTERQWVIRVAWTGCQNALRDSYNLKVKERVYSAD